MTPSRSTVVVIAKAPVPGRVKTRLSPPCSPEQAAGLAEAALADTLEVVSAAPAARRVLALDGAPGPWLPPGFDVVPQVPGGLDVRIAAAFAAGTGPTLLVGMDTPQMTPQLLAPALRAGAGRYFDAWFGPASDGGFWALGLAEPDSSLVLGVPMSEPRTGEVQRQRLTAAGLRVCDLTELTDVDTAQDTAVVAALAPRGRFARVYARTDAPTDVPATPPSPPQRTG